MIKFSKNFTLKELTRTSKPFLNEPTKTETLKLLYLSQYILQPIRDEFGTIRVSSGFRSGSVNKAVGGSSTSQHRKGEAADIVPRKADIQVVYEWIIKNLSYGQIISETARGKQWLHVSLPRIGKPNNQALVYDGKKYMPYKV